MTFTVTGSDAAHYSQPSDFTFTVLGRSSFSFNVSSLVLYTSAVSPAISVAPLAAPATGGVTLHVDITASGGTVSQATLNFPAAATLPLTFVYTAGSVIGSSYELVFSVTGVDDNHYYTPANFSITILARTTFNFNVIL